MLVDKGDIINMHLLFFLPSKENSFLTRENIVFLKPTAYEWVEGGERGIRISHYNCLALSNEALKDSF